LQKFLIAALLSFRITEADNARPSLLYGSSQNLSDCLMQSLQLWRSQIAGGLLRMNGGMEKDLTGIDVANSGDDLLIHDNLLDRGLFSAEGVA
jgi:hypothetical protein